MKNICSVINIILFQNKKTNKLRHYNNLIIYSKFNFYQQITVHICFFNIKLIKIQPIEALITNKNFRKQIYTSVIDNK